MKTPAPFKGGVVHHVWGRERRRYMRRMQELWKVSSWAAWEPVIFVSGHLRRSNRHGE